MGLLCGDVCNCKKRCKGFGMDAAATAGCENMCSSYPNMWTVDDYIAKTAVNSAAYTAPIIAAEKDKEQSELASKTVQKNFFIGFGVMILLLLIIFIIKKRSKK